MAWLAIDAGTSVIKSVLFASDGRELTLARANTEVLHPKPGWSEQDMDAVWAAVATTVREAVGRSPEPVTGIVSTAQGDGCWLVDAEGRPTGHAVLWNDARAAATVGRWRAAGAIDEAFRISGSVTYPGLANAILAHLRAHEPGRLARARWALTANGWLFAQLTGSFAADLSDASNPWSDVRRRAYSGELCTLFGAGEHAALLPPILPAPGSAGALTATAARALGLSPGLPVVMAPYDIVATAYGAGAASPGQACVILGTTLCAELLAASLDLDGTPQGTTIALHDGLYLRAMPTLTGCEALDWTARMLGLSGIPALEALASAPEAANARVFFLPYLSPAGERSPFLAPEACGSFHGLSFTATPAHIARSVYEGLAFVIRECLGAASPQPVRAVHVCGGGSRSDLWCGILADVLGCPVLRARDRENGARGAHLFALLATGAIPSIPEGVRRHVHHSRIFPPSAEAHPAYGKRFALWQALRDTARAQWRALEPLP